MERNKRKITKNKCEKMRYFMEKSKDANDSFQGKHKPYSRKGIKNDKRASNSRNN